MAEDLSSQDVEELSTAVRRAFSPYRAPALDVADLERRPALDRGAPRFPRLFALSATAGLAVIVAGVMVAQQLAQPTSVFAGWTAVPSSPDPALALVADDACREGMAPPPADVVTEPSKIPDPSNLPRVALDQRGDVALALFSDGRTFASCIVTRAGSGGFTAVGLGTIEGPREGPVRVLSGIAHEGQPPLRLVVGDVAAEVASVTISRSDGVEVRATVRDGYFLAWWPTDGGVTSITAFGASGLVLGSLVGDIFE